VTYHQETRDPQLACIFLFVDSLPIDYRPVLILHVEHVKCQ
jgi:hypothetical protein